MMNNFIANAIRLKYSPGNKSWFAAKLFTLKDFIQTVFSMKNFSAKNE